jgi:hypothetical protein
MMFERDRIRLKERLLCKWLTLKERFLRVIYPAHRRILCLRFSPALVDTGEAETQGSKIFAKPG